MIKHISEMDFSEIKCVVWDFDGVFTDNAVYVDENGMESVRCYRSDGIGITALQSLGIVTFVLSKEKNPVVSARCKKIGIKCFQGIDDKGEFLRSYKEEHNIQTSELLYVGNDINDLPAFKEAGISIGVVDRYVVIDPYINAITARKGGNGAVREVCDLMCSEILKEYSAFDS